MTRLAVWLSELYYEDNPKFGRRISRLPSLILKTLFTIPHAFMLLFCNFGSAMPRTRRDLDPNPSDAEIQEASLTDWPRSRITGFDRGLPYSAFTITRLDLGTSLARVDDVAFVLSEVRRVCRPGATVRVAMTSRDDPFQRRAIVAESIPHLLREGFAVASQTADHVELTVQKERDTDFPTRRIDIGSGSKPREGYAGIDFMELPGVSIVRDVERHGLPFSDSTITHVYTAHFLEHVADLVFVMNEIHRVCCHDALVEINVPTLLGPFAAADPTHVHLFNARTFRYFEADDDPYAGITKGFEILSQHVSFSLDVKMRVIKAPRTAAGETAR